MSKKAYFIIGEGFTDSISAESTKENRDGSDI